VVWSWNRYEALASGRTNLANSASPEAPVLSASAPDAKTVVFKLAFPRAEILDLFAGPGPRIMPREFEDRNKADVRNTMLGSGAWMMTAAESGVRLQYRKNPNWWRKDRPFLDGFDVFISPETSTNIAQFRAQNFWWGNATIPQEQILDTKRDFPELQMIGGSEYSTGSKHVKFGWRPNSPFQDVRVRRAVSLAIDRDLYAETLSHIAQFEAAGFPRELRWASHIGPGWEGIWLDPRANGGKALGEGGKYFQYNPAEAKKLLSAAGYSDGLTVDSSFNARGYGATYFDELEIVSGMLEEVGFKVNRKPREYETEWLPNYFYSRGDFDGLSWGPGAGRAGVGIFVQNFYHSAGVGNIPEGVDPKLDDMIRKQAEELDRETRIEQIQEIQKYMAVEMKVVPHDYSIPAFELAWPWVKNFGTFVGWPGGTNATQQIYIHNWIDKSLLPGRFQTS
jgi:ABC-type transport system substrate-binding protein